MYSSTLGVRSSSYTARPRATGPGGRGPALQSPLGLSALRRGDREPFPGNAPAISGNPGPWRAASPPWTARAGIHRARPARPGPAVGSPSALRTRLRAHLVPGAAAERQTLPRSPSGPRPGRSTRLRWGDALSEGSLRPPHGAQPGASVAPLGRTRTATSGIGGCGSPHPGPSPSQGGSQAQPQGLELSVLIEIAV